MQKGPYVIDTRTEERLAAIRQNDAQALKALYTENYPKVEAFVCSNQGTAEEARDIYQEAFVAVWRNIQTGRFKEVPGASLSGYLYQVARHKWLDYLRSQHHKKTVPLPAPENGELKIEEEWSKEEEGYLQAVSRNFSRLGEACQDLLKRFYFSKESLRSIAAAFNWTEATAKNNKYRCLQRLREFIKNDKP